MIEIYREVHPLHDDAVGTGDAEERSASIEEDCAGKSVHFALKPILRLLPEKGGSTREAKRIWRPARCAMSA